MKSIMLLAVAAAALSANGRIQTLPDGLIAAAPQTAALMSPGSRGLLDQDTSAIPAQHVVQYDVNGRPVAASAPCEV